MSPFEKDKDLFSGKGEWDETDHPRDNDGKFTSNGGEAQSNTKQSKHENKKDKKVKSLDEQVESVLNGSFTGSHVVLSEETPQILQDIGIQNKPMLITAKHTYLAINDSGKYTKESDHYHNLGKETFMMIPKLLQSPMMVLQNDMQAKDIIAVLDWYDKDENILICPIRIGGYGQYNELSIEGNIVKSVYGRQNLKNYINKNFNSNDILAISNKKIRDIHR